jgi:hypothetical protein
MRSIQVLLLGKSIDSCGKSLLKGRLGNTGAFRAR